MQLLKAAQERYSIRHVLGRCSLSSMLITADIYLVYQAT